MEEKKEIESLPSIDRRKILTYINKLKVARKSGYLSGYGYLDKLGPEIKEFIIDIDMKENLNLYHSVAAYINGKNAQGTAELYEQYILKYGPIRKYVDENKDKIKKLIEILYIDLKTRRKQLKHI